MDKYIVKPTQIIGDDGYIYNTNNFDQTPAISELKKKLDNIGDNITERVEEAEEKANIAHNTVMSMVTDFNVVAKSAQKADENAIEAMNSIHSLNADYENLKSRVEDLEKTDGQASVPIVGNSKMGYNSDFTDYGLNGKTYVQAKWSDEIRSLQFGKEDNIGEVIEELIYVTGSGLTSHNNRITALENGTVLDPTTPSTGGNCSCPSDFDQAVKDTTVTYQRYAQVPNDIAESLGIDKTMNVTHPIGPLLSQNAQYVVAHEYVISRIKTNISNVESRITSLENNTESTDLTSINNSISTMNNTLASHTNSIQSLDTRTGSHTASIGQLENRITDVELLTQANKNTLSNLGIQVQENIVNDINTLNDITLDLNERIETLEGQSGNTSGSSISHIGDLNIKSDGSSYSFTNKQEMDNPTYSFKTLNEVLTHLMPLLSDITKQLEEIWMSIDSIERSISDYH